MAKRVRNTSPSHPQTVARLQLIELLKVYFPLAALSPQTVRLVPQDDHLRVEVNRDLDRTALNRFAVALDTTFVGDTTGITVFETSNTQTVLKIPLPLKVLAQMSDDHRITFNDMSGGVGIEGGLEF